MLDVGDTKQLRFEVRDDSGGLVNPATALLRITLPDGTVVEPTIPLPPTEDGVLTYDLTVTQRGRHVVYWRTTAPDRAHADVFSATSPDWPAIVGLDEAKRHLGIPLDDHTDDEELRGFVLSASEVVEGIVGAVARRTVVETASGGGRHIVLARRPVIEVVDVTVDGATVSPGDYQVSPSGLLTHRSGWPAGSIEVTYLVGREEVPASVYNGTLELLRINWRPQQGGNYSPFDGAGADDLGLTAHSMRLGFFVPNTVVERLQPHQRGPVVL